MIKNFFEYYFFYDHLFSTMLNHLTMHLIFIFYNDCATFKLYLFLYVCEFFIIQFLMY